MHINLPKVLSLSHNSQAFTCLIQKQTEVGITMYYVTGCGQPPSPKTGMKISLVRCPLERISVVERKKNPL